MFENIPIHPAVVHLPIGLVFLMPIITLFMFFLYRKKVLTKTTYALVIILHIILSGSAYLALETGEDQEERVERVVDKQNIHEHEERAEAFMATSFVVLALSVILFLIPLGQLFKLGLAGLLGMQMILAFLGFRVGHSGGELVYVYGAGQAYALDANVPGVMDSEEHEPFKGQEAMEEADSDDPGTMPVEDSTEENPSEDPNDK